MEATVINATGPMLFGQGLLFFLAPRFFLIFICSPLRTYDATRVYLGHTCCELRGTFGRI